MSESTCQACHSRPTDDFVCQSCCDDLHGHLAAIPALEADLTIELIRQARKSGGPATHTPRFEQPLPYLPVASKLLAELRTELVTAVRVITLDQSDDWPSDTIPAMCAWLTGHEASIPLRVEGPDIVAGIARAVARAQRCIDLPPERLYIGTCDCGADMYPHRGQATHRCRTCGAEWDVATVVAWRDQQAHDQLLTLADIALLSGIKLSTLRKWVTRGRLPHASVDRDGARTYRYGEALALHGAREAS